MNLDLDHFARRILQDALTEATAAYWLHRADQIEWAAPRRGDYNGHAERDDLLDTWERCKEAAQNCRNHAALIATEGLPDYVHDEIAAALDEAQEAA